MLHAHRLEQFDAGDRRRARPVHHHAAVLDAPAGQFQGVDQPRRGDDRGAVLVVMEHRDIHQLAQTLFDDETFRRLDVFQVDAADALAEKTHAVDEFVDIGGIDLQVDTVDIREPLEQHRLALHHRLRRQRADVAQAEHGRAVRDHRHDIAAVGVFVGIGLVLGDAQAGHRDAGRIGEGQIALCGQRLGRRNLHLARSAAGVELQGFFVCEMGVVHGLTRSRFQRCPAARMPRKCARSEWA